MSGIPNPMDRLAYLILRAQQIVHEIIKGIMGLLLFQEIDFVSGVGVGGRRGT